MSTTIGSLSTSTTSNIRGYGGLASGLDRDTLIEGMTYGTTSKITAQQQKKQQLEWKQAAVQSITNLMVSFANKYTSSLSSPTSLFSSVFWGRSNITTTGANSKYVSVSGNASSADAITIMGVKQLAQKAKWSSEARTAGQASSALTTGDLNTDKAQFRKELIGESLTFKYGSESYTIFLNTTDSEGNELKYDTAENAVNSINTLLAEEKAGDGTLADHFKISVAENGPDGKAHFMFSKVGGDGNNHSITGGSALEYLGFEEPGEDGYVLSGTNGSITAKEGTDKITTAINYAQQLAGKSLSFTYNGVTKSIKLADEATLSKGVTFKEDGTLDDENAEKLIANLKSSLQDSLNSAFGKGRIQVGGEGRKLSFQTMNVTTGEVDETATLTLNSGSSGLLGTDGALNVKSGTTNKLNLSSTIKELGLTKNVTFDQDSDRKDEDGNVIKKATIRINDADIDVYEDDTINSLMSRINKDKNAGVQVSYQAATDKFTFTATENGASGTIKFGVNDQDILDETMTDEQKAAALNGNNLLENIFGATITKNGEEIRGQDAIVTVKYAGSDEEIDLYRDSNNFTVDGLTIGVKGVFGYKAEVDADGNEVKDKNGNVKMVRDKTDDPVEINASVNTDSIIDAVKSMVEEYNAIIELVNKEVSTKPDRDYSPLTSDQKKELSEDEIKLYEEKAKQGLLFGDSDLRTLSSDLRFVISGGNIQAFENIGITTSSSYSDNGKLTLDESKLRAALESDPESVEKLFTGTASTNADGTATYNGLATNLKEVMTKYVETMGSWESKGILIRKAGSETSPLSITENYMYKQIAEINKQITKLQEKLESERDRYVKQFTSLETLISQMNSQSNWLSQIGGSY